MAASWRVCMTQEDYSAYIEQQYTLSLILLSLLAIVFQPAFHFILRLLPGLAPDSLALRLVSVIVSAALLVAVLLVRSLRRWTPWLQIVNAATALIVVHQLVLNSGNHPMYLAASLTAVYGAQLAFVRLREWIWTAGLVFAFYIGATLAQGVFTTPQDLVAPVFYSANYVITTALVFGRDRLLSRDFRRSRELERKNAELNQVTRRLQNDLVLAREIQHSLLPPPAPAWPLFDVLCYSQPAREVGGDFYSYYAWSDVHVAVVVGDVSGKGVSAALLMATSLSLVNAAFTRKSQPQLRVARLDHQLLAYTGPRDQNCALCYAEVDGQLLTIVNAGGIAPYIRRANGRVEATDAWGFALGQGLGAQMGYQPVQLRLARGDLLILVSDGVLEARNERGAMFSFARLEQAIRSGPNGSAEAMINHLLRRLKKFTGRVEPHDDVTIVALRVC